MNASRQVKTPASPRQGDSLRIEGEFAAYGRNALASDAGKSKLQHRLFVNDPWELIAEAIARAVKPGRARDVAQSFRLQAEDYFRAATSGRELAVKPVLLYYAFLNLSKAYAVAKGNIGLTGKAFHGISCAPNPKTIPGTLIRFDRRTGTLVFQELMKLLDGNPSALSLSGLRLGYLLPQILPGHRLWCYATNRTERFSTIEYFDLLHAPATKQVWLNLYIDRDDLDRLKISESRILSQADLGEFEVAYSATNSVFLQQRNPDSYSANPAEAFAALVRRYKNKIWETVKTASPYRKSYVYCCPPQEQSARLPQTMSIYLLMYFLGSVTRYTPGHFEDLLDSKYGPFFGTFVSESPMQFLYLMASETLGREVSKPAII
jgi:hypothetical protein